MDDGIFHDAHDLYVRSSESMEWMWVATFMSKVLADNYSTSSAIPAGTLVEVRPV